MDEPNDGQESCCCMPMTEESQELKRLKPMLIGGIVIYVILIFVDSFYTKDYQLFDYLFLIIFLCLLTFNRCHFIFQIYTLYSLFIVFGTAVHGCGLIIQNKFKKPSLVDGIIKFFIYLFMIVFSFFIFYIGFSAYKEIRSLYEARMQNNPQLIPGYMAPGSNQSTNNGGNNYYNSNNDNNNSNNNSKSKGFKAFSGKGYTVGGS